MGAINKPPTANQRLGSWKEIAAFFGCDERTLRRWEKERGLPVHRPPGGAGGKVFAFTDELSAWLATPRNEGPVGESADSETVKAEEVESSATASYGYFWKIGMGIAACVLLLGLGWLYQSHSRAVAAEAATATHDPQAEKLYLQGRYYWNKRTPESLNQAVDYFTQAIVHDPSYALAYGGLADSYNLLREYTAMPAGEAYPRALAAAKKAVELDDRSSEAHASLAFALFYGQWDVAGADKEFRRAIGLNPNNAVAHHWYATYLMTLRRFPESLAEIDRAQTLDPDSTTILADKGLILVMAGKRDEGVTLWKQIEASEPGFRSPHVYLREYALQHGDYENFLKESKRDAELVNSKTAQSITAAAEKGFAEGGAPAMFAKVLQTQQELYTQGSVTPFALARTYAAMGNREEAFRYLNLAFEQHDEALLCVENVWEFEALHADPAYRKLVARMNLPLS